MKKGLSQAEDSHWPWWLAGGCGLVLLIALLLPRPDSSSQGDSAQSGTASVSAGKSRNDGSLRARRQFATGSPAETAEELVAQKLKQFSKSRRKLARGLGEHRKAAVPGEVEKFFDLAAAGKWEELHAYFTELDQLRKSDTQPAGFHEIFWPAIMETYGVAEVAHNWPAQKLLDYGESVLGALRPGMIYVGGNDAGRFIPTLLNETSSGEKHIVMTQNAFADATYLDYVRFQYGDQLTALSAEDSQHTFQDYLTDAQRRLHHDQDFPDENKQMRPGEDVRVTDNRVQVSGQVAVMAINEKLLQLLMDKNPDATFAIEQSFPFQSLYSNAVPLGPIMELRVSDAQSVFTAERAAQTVDYWRTAAQQLLSDPEASEGSDPRKAYSKLASEQAALLLDHKYTAEAEQAFRIANEICPSSAEVVFRYVALLAEQKRFTDAVPVVERAMKADPECRPFRDLLNQLKRMK